MFSKRKCFLVGPIGAPNSEARIHADWLLDGIVQPAFEQIGNFEVVRADKITTPGMIDAQIINHLLDDDLVIADMTFLNANVFYEIGIRHMIEKPIVHMFRVDTDIPFDVRPYRAIPFSVTQHADVKKANIDLVAAVNDALSSEHEVENPVTRARGKVALKNSATPRERLFIEMIDSQQKSIEELRRRVETIVPSRGVLSSILANVSSNKLSYDCVRFNLKENASDEVKEQFVAFANRYGLIFLPVLDGQPGFRIPSALPSDTHERLINQLFTNAAIENVRLTTE